MLQIDENTKLHFTNRDKNDMVEIIIIRQKQTDIHIKLPYQELLNEIDRIKSL